MDFQFDYIFRGLSLPEIEEELKRLINTALQEKYGRNPDCEIQQRVAEEWEAIRRGGMIADTAALYELTVLFKKNRCPYYMNAVSGASFILYLLGVTTGNPLPAHYYCPECKAVTWMPDCKDGFDLEPNETCPDDNAPMIPDGHNIPWQAVWRYSDFPSGFDVMLPSCAYEQFLEELPAHWLTGFFPDCFSIESLEIRQKYLCLSNIGLQFFWDIEKISPDFYEKSFSVSDRDSIIKQWKTLVGNRSAEYESIPDPTDVADVISAYGLIHSTGTWDTVTEFMVYQMDYSLSDLIAFRDDIFFYLRDHGLSVQEARRGMECVRKGKGCPVMTEEMLHSRDKWVADRINRIAYLFPKAHAVEHIAFQLKAHYNREE